MYKALNKTNDKMLDSYHIDPEQSIIPNILAPGQYTFGKWKSKRYYYNDIIASIIGLAIIALSKFSATTILLL